MGLGTQIFFPAGPVITGFGTLGLRLCAHGFDFVRGTGAKIGVAPGHQFFHIVLIYPGALTLVIRSLVPIDFQPIQGVENRLHGLFSGAGFVGIFDSQDEFSLGMASEEPVE